MVKAHYKLRFRKKNGRGGFVHELPDRHDVGIVTADALDIYRIVVEQGVKDHAAKEAMEAVKKLRRVSGTRRVHLDQWEGFEIWATKLPDPKHDYAGGSKNGKN